MTTQPEVIHRPPESTLQFLYQHLRDVTERQVRDAADTDGKILQLFAAASVVLGLTGFSQLNGPHSHVAVALLLCGLVAYLALAVIALYSQRPRELQVTRYGDVLYKEFWNQPVDQIEQWLVEQVQNAYPANAAVLNAKANALFWAVLATASEVLLIAAGLIADKVGAL